jgi:peptidoglycan hydrolase CwlO-like protein
MKIEGTSLERDMNSKGLVETKLDKALEYKQRRQKLKERFDEKDQRIKNLETQIDAIWAEINRLRG